MGTSYNDELSASILLVYCSDNDSPDKVFPADPRLVQAHKDAQNEPRPPPTPPGSPISGIATPSTAIMEELWEAGRSPTPSPTFDVPISEMPDKIRKTEVPLEIKISQLTIDRSSNGTKKTVTFSLRIEMIEYHHNIDNKKFKRFLDKMKKKDRKRREKLLKMKRKLERTAIEEFGCNFLPTAHESTSMLKKVAATFGITPKTKTYRAISSVARRVKSFTSRIISQ